MTREQVYKKALKRIIECHSENCTAMIPQHILLNRLMNIVDIANDALLQGKDEKAELNNELSVLRKNYASQVAYTTDLEKKMCPYVKDKRCISYCQWRASIKNALCDTCENSCKPFHPIPKCELYKPKALTHDKGKDEPEGMKVKLVRCSDNKVVGEWDYKGKDECPEKCPVCGGFEYDKKFCPNCSATKIAIEGNVLGIKYPIDPDKIGTGLKTPEHCEITPLDLNGMVIDASISRIWSKINELVIAVNKLSGKDIQ